MEFTARQIAEFLNGEVEGDPHIIVNDVSKIEEGKQGTLAFLANPKYEKYIYDTRASVVLVNMDFKPDRPVPCTLVRVADAYQAVAELLRLREKMEPVPSGIERDAYVDSRAQIGNEVYIGHFSVISAGAVIGNNARIYPHVFIGKNVVVGDSTVIYPGTRIYPECRIGSECTLHSGVVVGGDGFGFAPRSDSNYTKVPQVGNVIIEDHVEIGSNTTIDRAMIGSTILRKGVKLDNLIQVAHNVEIGENTVIAAQSGIAGSTKIGAGCMIGGQVGIIGHITIADGVKIAAQSGVGVSITDKDDIVQGSPAFHYGRYQRSYILYKKLPELYQQIRKLENEMDDMKRARSNTNTQG
ncbi:MAG: UDP-3-O-(3-hydroxymyristoyl)glucosamine N-acyltransferase [Bacteroidales bacterium]